MILPCLNDSGATVKTLPGATVLPHSVRRLKLIKLMKNKFNSARNQRVAFTLVELLVVIAIIGILAAMLLPVLVSAKNAAKKAQARTEMADIVNAINAYDTDYGRFPVSTNEQAAAYLHGNNDFTCGYVANPQLGINWPTGAGGNYSFDNNNNVVAILMDLTAYPDGTPTANVNHQKNPKQVKYLNAKLSGDAGTGDQPRGGVDNNYIYRDPWGNPYVITMDLSYDDQCSDLFYCQQAVSQKTLGSGTGYNGLFNPSANPNTDNFLYHGKVMVWSAGPNKKVDSGDPATDHENRDNVLSWQ
jgi:prepilin-type N-terminal cleavage/methylation domain-containing protein